MNNVIKQLALQAGGSHYPDVGGKTLEKFAELVVQECIANLYLNGYDDAVIQIQQHFGVEE